MNAPAFQLYVSNFMASTFDWSQADVGALIRLLCTQWDRGFIPDDMEKLRRLAGGKVSAEVLAKFPVVSEGQRQNARLEAVRNEQAAYKQTQSVNGLAGARKRWGNHKTQGRHKPNDGGANGGAIASPLANGWPKNSSPSPSPKIHTPLPPNHVPESSASVEARRGGDGDSEVGNPEPKASPDVDHLRLIESVWAVWPKKIRELAAKREIGVAIGRHGVEAVLAGTRAIAEADARRNVTPPGRYLPDPESFFAESRYMDDPAQYGPREQVQDEATLRKRIAQLRVLIQEHPGNPEGAFTDARKEKERDGWKALVREKRELVEKLGKQEDENE